MAAIKVHSNNYMDADLSTHLSQPGLLLDLIIHRDKIGAVGSRRARQAVMVMSGGHNTRGKLHVYLWKHASTADDAGDLLRWLTRRQPSRRSGPAPSIITSPRT
jgi:hypothetical protein